MPETAEQAADAAPEPAVETTTQPQAPAAPAAETPETNVDPRTLPPAEAFAILYKGKSITGPVVENADPADEQQQAAPAEQQAPAAPEGVKPPEAATEPPADDVRLPHRIPTSQFDPDTQRALATMHAMNDGRKPGEDGYVNLRQVMDMLTPKAQPQQAAPLVQQPDPAQVAASRVDQIEAQIADLRRQRQDQIDNGNPTDETESQLEKANRALISATVQAEVAKTRVADEQAREAAQAEAQLKKLRTESRDRAVKDYPDAANPTSPIGVRLVALRKAMEDPTHPDHGMLYTATIPEVLVQKAVNQLAYEASEKENIPLAQALARFTPKAVPSQAAPAPQPPAAAEPQPRKVLPASGGNRTTPPVAAKPPEQLVQEAKNNPKLAREYLYGASGETFL